MNQELLILLTGVSAGLGLGAIYTVVALGYNLILAASGIFNFSLGAVVMGGTVAGYYLSGEWGLPVYAAVPAVLVLGYLAGTLSYYLVVRTVARSRDVNMSAVITSLGLGLAAIAVAGLTFGVNNRSVPSYVSTRPTFLGEIPIRPIYIVMVAVAVIIAVTVDLLLRRTTIGQAVRATLEDREGAQLQGVATESIVRNTFALAGMLAGLAGFLIAPITGAEPTVGTTQALYGFAAVAIGGFGSFGGAVTGGLIVGLTTGIVPAFLEPGYVTPVVIGIMFLVLLIRPQGLQGAAGLFGAKAQRDV
jgi:branched-chain amino acid transport system permease protein